MARFAELLGVGPGEIADRAGVATPVPGGAGAMEQRLTVLERRVAALEAELAARQRAR